MEPSALSLLTPGQLCMLVIADGGHRRMGTWNPNLPGFHLCESKEGEIAFVQDVAEWWPVS